MNGSYKIKRCDGIIAVPQHCFQGFDLFENRICLRRDDSIDSEEAPAIFYDMNNLLR